MYKVLYYVNGNTKDSLNGKVIEMPIIPRVGDYVDLNYKVEEKDGSSHGVGLVAEVTKVYILDSSQKVNAQVHVKVDE